MPIAEECERTVHQTTPTTDNDGTRTALKVSRRIINNHSCLLRDECELRRCCDSGSVRTTKAEEKKEDKNLNCYHCSSEDKRNHDIRIVERRDRGVLLVSSMARRRQLDVYQLNQLHQFHQLDQCRRDRTERWRGLAPYIHDLRVYLTCHLAALLLATPQVSSSLYHSSLDDQGRTQGA
jgi:hypothetical protein